MTVTDDTVQRIAQTLGMANQGMTHTGPLTGLPATLCFPITPNDDRASLRALDRREADADLRALLREATGTGTTPLAVLAAGDSITVGGNSLDGLGYRGWLADLLDRRRITATVDLAGSNGLTLAALAPLVTAALAAKAYDIVLLAVGTNDAAFNDSTFNARYATLVDQILASSATVKVACAHIPIAANWSTSVQSDSTLPSKMTTLNNKITAVIGDRLAGGRVTGIDPVPTDWLTDGGWHPGDAGYLRMARNWLAAITPWLPEVV